MGKAAFRDATLPRPTFASLVYAPILHVGSLLSPFFSLFRGDSGLDNPPETICFQMVGQKTPSRAEQDHNREIIRA
jgi:hypothetical protein